MSVTSALYTGVSGLLANSEGINVIGSNLANVNTVGFKGSRVGFSDLLSVTVGNTVGSNNQIGRGVQIQKIDNTFSQGSFETTENASDLAIQGESFFVLGAVDSPAGIPITGMAASYTRAGSFRINPDPTIISDKYLTNPDGLRVLDEDGNPIVFQTNDPPVNTDFVRISSIDPQGRITFLRFDNTAAYYDRTTPGGTQVQAEAKKIGTLNIPGKNYLEKSGGSIYKPTSATTGVPLAAAPRMYSATYSSTVDPVTGAVTGGTATTERIFSSSLEQSNVDMAAQFVKMILTQRAYSANSKTITTADQMTQELLNLKQ
ncbi:MAG TPA: flagellar hook basal-body protein [Desulfuromonadales bacterium]|nr:flagellar hook basal-body protein [Desulfuromonadales bacterium]